MPDSALPCRGAPAPVERLARPRPSGRQSVAHADLSALLRVMDTRGLSGHRLMSLARDMTAAKSFRIAGRYLAAVLVVLLGLRLWQLWERDPVDFHRVNAGFFGAAVLASVVAVSAYGLVWPFLLQRLGIQASSAWVALFFKSQLGKYLPGSVWQYAGRIGLVRARGVPTQAALISLVVEVAVSALAAGAVSVLVLPARWAIVVSLPLAAVVLIAGRRLATARLPLPPRLDSALVSRALHALPAAGALYLLVWVAYGAAFWLTGRALFAVSISELPRYTGVFALSWLAGLVAVFAPGGIGVREAVIVGLLGGRLGEPEAIVLAATSRIILTAVDLGAGALSLSLPRLRRRPTPSEPIDPPKPATGRLGAPR
jgi:uncharacterized membrane protein YbhN (UPF0104 family)